jgi:hypothetical protein
VDKQNVMYKTAYPRWTAYMLMKNSNQGKYRSLMMSLMTQFSMGTNQYPEDILKAVDILASHKFDKREPKNNKNNLRNKNQNDDDTASTITTQSSFNQEDAKKAQCSCCGKKGHNANKCPEKGKRPKDEWAMGSEEGYMMHAQSELEKESEDKDEDDNASQASRRSNKSDTKEGWNGLNIWWRESLHNNRKLWASGTKGNSILLDNGSSLSLFGNPEMVTNIRELKTTPKLAMNVGMKTT